MTIFEAIAGVDSVKPNGYSQEQKIAWLSKLDGTIKTEIIDTHEGGEAIEFSGYSADSLNKELLVYAPYDDIYIRYLEMQIDYVNGEYPRYNNSKIMFNEQLTAFKRHYNRTHMPKGRRVEFF